MTRHPHPHIDLLIREALAADADDVDPRTGYAWGRLQRASRRRGVRFGSSRVALAAGAAVFAIVAALNAADDGALIQTTTPEDRADSASTNTTAAPGALGAPAATATTSHIDDRSAVDDERSALLDDGSPRFVAGIRQDGGIVLLDRRIGDRRQIAQFDDPRETAGERTPLALTVSATDRIVYVGVYGSNSMYGEIISVPFDGSGEMSVVSTGLEPAVSPDGRWLATVSVPRTNVDVRNLETGEQFALALEGVLADPAWSPDGTRVAVDRYHADGGSVAILGFDAGRGLVHQTTIESITGHPVWPGNDTIMGVDQRASCTDCADPEPGILRTVRVDGSTVDERQLDQPILSMESDDSGRYVLVLDGTGAVTAIAPPPVLAILRDSAFRAADW